MFGWFRRRWESVKGLGRYVAERPVRLAAVGGAFLGGLIAGVPVGDAGYDYSWRDPYFCDDCHMHDYADEAWGRSVHAGVTTCHDCHKVPVMAYPMMTMGTIFWPPHGPEDMKRAHVPSHLCAACHVAASTEELTGPMTEEVRAQVVKIDESPLHRVHLDSKTRDPGAYLGADHDLTGAVEPAPESHDAGHGEGSEGVIECLDCHGSGGGEKAHRYSAARANCLACHGGLDVAVGRLTELRCRECHFSGFVGRSLTQPTTD